MESQSVESRVRVRYKDTDRMGIAHHANYIVWFEIGRTDLCREAGVSYREIETRGLLLVVSEIGCTYRRPFEYDDEVRVLTSIDQLGSRRIAFRYQLRREDDPTVCAEGVSRHIWLDRTSRRPVTAPAGLLEVFRSFTRQ